MSMLFTDSFDDRTSNFHLKWGGASSSMASVSGRTGLAMQLTTGGAGGTITGVFASMGMAANYATLIMGFAVKYNGGGAGQQHLLTIQDGSSTQFTVRQNATTHTLSICDSAGTVLGTSTTAMTAGTYFYIELQFTINNSTGVAILKINGTTEVNLSGVDTQGTGNAYATGFKFFADGFGGSSVDIDDLYFFDTTGSAPWNTFASGGDPNKLPAVKCKFPSGAGNTTQWTPSAGSNYQCVDEVTMNSDTDYVSSTTVGNKDTYALGSSGLSGNVILGVQLTRWTKLDATGSRQHKSKIRSGGADYNGATVTDTATAAYLPYFDVFQTDPATSAQWTQSNMDAAEAGQEMVA